MRQQSLLRLDLLFGPLLPAGLLSQTEEGPNSRQHVYSVRRAFFGFLHQALNPECPCREVVRQIQSLLTLGSPRRVSPDTGAYCQARGRLPLEILSRLRGAVAAQTRKTGQLWQGFCVKVIDGTSLRHARHAGKSTRLPPVQGTEARLWLSVDEGGWESLVWLQDHCWITPGAINTSTN